MLFSIIIPVYNSGKTLKRCLESIYRQNEIDMEILLIDDGSIDDSGMICDEAAEKDSRIVSIHQQNRGPASARNTGLRVARGEYVLFLDSDDIYLEGGLERIAGLIRGNKPDVVIGCFRAVSKEGRLLFEKDCDLGEGCTEQHKVRDMIRAKRIAPNVWRYVIKRKVIIENKLFFEEGLYLAEDVLWTVKMLCTAQKFCLDASPFYQYCMNPQSITACMDYNKLKDIMSVSEKLYDFAVEQEEDKKLLSYNYICIILNSMLQQYRGLNRDERIKIRKWMKKQNMLLKRALRAQPLIRLVSGIMGSFEAMLFFADIIRVKRKLIGE